MICWKHIGYHIFVKYQNYIWKTLSSNAIIVILQKHEFNLYCFGANIWENKLITIWDIMISYQLHNPP